MLYQKTLVRDLNRYILKAQLIHDLANEAFDCGDYDTYDRYYKAYTAVDEVRATLAKVLEVD